MYSKVIQLYNIYSLSTHFQILFPFITLEYYRMLSRVPLFGFEGGSDSRHAVHFCSFLCRTKELRVEGICLQALQGLQGFSSG